MYLVSPDEKQNITYSQTPGNTHCTVNATLLVLKCPLKSQSREQQYSYMLLKLHVVQNHSGDHSKVAQAISVFLTYTSKIGTIQNMLFDYQIHWEFTNIIVTAITSKIPFLILIWGFSPQNNMYTHIQLEALKW